MRAIFAASLLGFGIWTTSVLAQTPRSETAGDHSTVFRGPSAPVLQPAASTDVSAIRRRRAKKLRIKRLPEGASPIRPHTAADRARDMERIRRSWPRSGLGIELYGDLGGNFGLNSPRLANFGQTLERGSGLYGGGGIVLIVPIPGDTPGLSGLHLRTGGQVLHSASEALRVNNDAGGFLRTRGHHNTTAAFGTLGFGLGPFDGMGALGRIRFTFDGGLGRAFHDLSVFGPGGNQVIRSNDSSLAWMVRGAAIYQVTDSFGLGVFALRLETSGIAAHLANGNAFALGHRTEYMFGLTGRFIYAGPTLDF